MPQLDTSLDEALYLHSLLYGPEKAKKTLWAGSAAIAGFHVILFDGEGGSSILKLLPEDARKRVYIINVKDTFNRAVMAETMVMLLRTGKMYYHEGRQAAAMHPFGDAIEVDISQPRRDLVVVIDSYTALKQSVVLRFCIENRIDLSDAQKITWDGYGWSGLLLSWMLDQICKMPCHMLLIGHETVYEKKKTVGDKQVVEWAKTQIASVSGPHGLTIAQRFEDILRFAVTAGRTFTIDTRKDDSSIGGCRNIPPAVYPWEKLQFSDVCQMAHIPLPNLGPIELPKMPASTGTLGGLGIAAPVKPTVLTNTQPAATVTTPVVPAAGGIAALLNGGKS